MTQQAKAVQLLAPDVADRILAGIRRRTRLALLQAFFEWLCPQRWPVAFFVLLSELM